MKNLKKYTGVYVGSCCQNSFVIMDCRNKKISKKTKSDFAKEYILKYKVNSALFINNSKRENVFLEIFEKDGFESDYCGNGLMLIAHFLNLRKGTIKMKGGIAKVYSTTTKEFLLIDHKYISVGKITPHSYFIRIGEPHVVYVVDNIDKFNLKKIGKDMQENYISGVNVDLVEKINKSKFKIKTYERGVMAETKSCGTGSLSSYVAVSLFYNKIDKKPIEFRSKGGIHKVSYEGDNMKLETDRKYCTIEEAK